MTTFEKLSNAITANLEKAGIYEHRTHYILNGVLNAESYVVDLGANVGNFYKLIHNKYNCTCYAVEASPKLFAELPVVPKVFTYCYAIGKRNGETQFYLSKESEANSIQPIIASASGLTDTITIHMITLEKFLTDQKIALPIDLLKIDIEGAEVDVINTLPADMLVQIKLIPVEFHDFLQLGSEYIADMHKAIKKLEDNNFKIVRISDYDNRAILCINRKLVHLSAKQNFRLNIMHPALVNLKQAHSALSRLLKGDKKNS